MRPLMPRLPLAWHQGVQEPGVSKAFLSLCALGGTRSFQPLLDKSPVTFSQYVPTDPPTKREEAEHTQPREVETTITVS